MKTSNLARAAAFLAAVVFAAAITCPVAAAEPPKGKGRLPLPALKVPDNPPLPPTVVTAGGRRLLLNHTGVEVAYKPAGGTKGAPALVVNRPGWWVINFPLERIRGFEGKSADEIARILFGKPASAVKNWYVKTPGAPVDEPPEPTGPAPIDLAAHPTIIVNNRHPKADDAGAGTADAPLKTISAAVERAAAGDVIRVYPGVYRESVVIRKNGTAREPILLEGVRGEDGRMPVITGNDLFPPGAWKPVEGLAGVFRADVFTDRLGSVSAAGVTLTERSLPGELRANEFCFNRASYEFLNLRLDPRADPMPGKEEFGKKWRKVRPDKEGFLDLRAIYGDDAERCVFWVSTYVWMNPSERRKPEWDPRFPEPIFTRAVFAGRFRAFRMTGARMSTQVNKFRVWANGALVPSCIRSSTFDDGEYRKNGRAYRMYGFSETIDNFPLREGWNHLVFQLDTTLQTRKADDLRFKMCPLYKNKTIVSTAVKPKDLSRPDEGESAAFVAEYLLLGPFPAEPDRGVYVRLAGDEDPNKVAMDMAARGSTLVAIEGSFVRVRGFEIRHGAQFQQRAQVTLFGEGSALEGCLVRDSEHNCVSFSSILHDAHKKPLVVLNQKSAPTVIRGNWIINPGKTGIGGSCSSDFLTADNQDADAPGRSRLLIEHNRIVNPNWTGDRPFWESGGMKLFKLTGTVIRYNTIIGGTGPGVWLDWEHYGNRLEGNFSRNGWSMLHGIEASPGPHLIANNLCVDLRPGEVWFRWALLAWSSGRSWAVNNTIDGRWNKTPAWQRRTGADGINLGTGGADRKTRWGKLTDRTNVHMNNLIFGCRRAIASRPGDVDAVNVTDSGTGADHIDEQAVFADPQRFDYRLKTGSPLNVIGVKGNKYTDLVKHDFYGLLRFDEDGRSVGAFRCERASASPGAMVEVETVAGEAIRLYKPAPLARPKTYNIFQADKVYPLPLVGKEWKDSPEYTSAGKVLWKILWNEKTTALEDAVGLDRAKWGGPMEWDAKKNRFKHSGAYLASGSGAHTFGLQGGSARPILVFVAPDDGKYLFYVHPGRISLWAAYEQIGVNLVHFPKGKTTGRSVRFVRIAKKNLTPLLLDELVEMKAGDELALVHVTNALGGGGGAAFVDYRFRVGFFGK